MQLAHLDRAQHALVLVLGERVHEQLAERADVAVLPRHGLVERARRPVGGQQVVDLVERQPSADRLGSRPEAWTASRCALLSRARWRSARSDSTTGRLSSATSCCIAWRTHQPLVALAMADRLTGPMLHTVHASFDEHATNFYAAHGHKATLSRRRRARCTASCRTRASEGL